MRLLQFSESLKAWSANEPMGKTIELAMKLRALGLNIDWQILDKRD